MIVEKTPTNNNNTNNNNNININFTNIATGMAQVVHVNKKQKTNDHQVKKNKKEESTTDDEDTPSNYSGDHGMKRFLPFFC